MLNEHIREFLSDLQLSSTSDLQHLYAQFVDHVQHTQPTMDAQLTLVRLFITMRRVCDLQGFPYFSLRDLLPPPDTKRSDLILNKMGDYYVKWRHFQAHIKDALQTYVFTLSK